jgi:carboxymethylenebutenolidase
VLKTDQVNDLQALLPGETTEQGATRRTALKAALGVGYAASVMPIAAQTAIQTSAKGLTVGDVTIDVNGFAMPAYRAAPEG